MDRRKIIITTLGVVIIALGVFLASRLSNGAASEELQEDKGEVKVAVRTKKVVNQNLTSYIPVTGRVIPHDNVELYAEVTGISSYGARPFKTGSRFRKGDVLIKIDDEEMRRSVISRKSEFMSLLSQVIPDLKIDFPDLYDPYRAYLSALDINKSLKALPETTTEQQRLFLAGRNVYSTFYSLKEAEARLKKYRIYAPFDGILTDALINEGTLVRTGQKLGEYIRTGVYELEASVSSSEIGYIKPGMELTMKNVNGDMEFTGKVTRVNERVDPNTQMVKVYLKITSEKLRSGMYLEGKLPKKNHESAMAIPTEALVGEDAVFVVENGKARLEQIQLSDRGQQESIIEGLSDGTEVIIDDKSEAFAGSAVVIANN